MGRGLGVSLLQPNSFVCEFETCFMYVWSILMFGTIWVWTNYVGSWKLVWYSLQEDRWILSWSILIANFLTSNLAPTVSDGRLNKPVTFNLIGTGLLLGNVKVRVTTQLARIMSRIHGRCYGLAYTGTRLFHQSSNVGIVRGTTGRNKLAKLGHDLAYLCVYDGKPRTRFSSRVICWDVSILDLLLFAGSYKPP